MWQDGVVTRDELKAGFVCLFGIELNELQLDALLAVFDEVRSAHQFR